MSPTNPERILFVTGRLAEAAVRRVAAETGAQVGFDHDVCVLPITVAALMHADWVRRKLAIESHFDRVLLPGWCQGDLDALSQSYGVPFELGPKDVRDLPEHFGQQARGAADLTRYDIEVLAEINHAPRLTDIEILRQAEHFRQSGADVIDVGCIPGETWARAGAVTALLRREGFRVSIDSFEPVEVKAAVDAGAELVLSASSGNIDWAAGLDVEFVAIPDEPQDLSSLERTIGVLRDRGRPFRVDPIVEPIGFGFAASLARYYEVRRRWPDVEMLMGVGNITEMVEVDSAGVNVLLAAICQELGIRSVLTTEVINWARSTVREFDIARRLVKHALDHRILAKHVDARLVMLRDPRLRDYGEDELQALAARLTDPNFRIFVERGEVHVMNRDGHWRGRDPFELFDRFAAESGPLDTSHAFYLGYELSKAVTALTLGKQYNQDQALQWGFLTAPEVSAVERRHAAQDRTARGSRAT
jgi:dihydropteroate synthase-like protein